MSVSEDSKQTAWLERYQRLLNVEFDWDPDHLSYQPPVEGPPIPITIDMVKKAISQMKAGTTPGPSGIVVEMIRAAGDMGASMIRDLAAAIIRDDWEQSFIVCLYKGKGGCIGKGQLPQSQADRVGYENPGEDCGRPHQTVGVNRRFPVWLRPRQRHYRRNLCCQAAAREVSSCQQETLHGFHRPGEGVWSSTSEGHLVGAEKTVWRSGLCYWCRGCMQMCGAMSVLVKGTVKSLKWRLVFTKDQYSARCSSSLCLKLYHESSPQGFPGRTSIAGLGGSVGCAVRLETRRSRVQPPPRSATFFRGDWSWNIFYGHSLPSADSRRAVVSFWRKNVHNTG